MKINAFKKSYNGRTVLDFPGFEFESGKIYAVIGANGSGKSTFARVLSGIEKADSGQRPCKAEVGYLPQKSYGFRMSVRKNLLLNGKDEMRADELLEEIGIEALKEANAAKLSGGETARMALCRLMMADYELAVFDEPTASMDMESTLRAEEMLCRYRDETGCAVILITHSIQQARRIADCILYFDKGQLAESGDCESLLADPGDVRTKKFIEFYGIR